MSSSTPLPLAIPTMSLSRPGLHALDKKLHSASHHGYTGVELFIDDLSHFANLRFNGSLIDAAKSISVLAKQLDITIICLQPFGFYEGLLDRLATKKLQEEKLPLWFELSRILETDLIQIPANFLPSNPDGSPQTTGDKGVIVADLQAIADIGAARGFRFVYEALCWSNHVNTWESSWDIVRAVDRENFGLCLDSFNIAGRIYADPADPSGKTVDAETAVTESMDRLRSLVRSGELDIRKIFYIQLVDGERLSSPLDKNHEFYVSGQPARMNWSRNARLFPCEEERGGYLPVLEIARTFFEIGYRGWVSLELFSRSCNDERPETVDEHARRGVVSWGRVVQRLGLDVDVPALPPLPSSRKESGNDRRIEMTSPAQHRL